MRALPKTICLIIPCYNERERLAQNVRPLSECPFPLIFVDDGSTDGTADWIRSQARPLWQVLSLPTNQGKAEAVRQGMLHACTLPEFDSLTWIGYWDADLSTPLDQVATLVSYQETLSPDAKAIYGSRVARLGSKIRRSARRHLLGRAFATMVGLLFPEFVVYDSQCGAKLLKPELLDRAFSKPFVSRWLFDLEILLRIRGTSVIECPLTNWEEMDGSKLPLILGAPRILLDLYHLRKTYR
jgi:dolichyl-phosphate beta-glucosyltransferase